MCVTCGWTGSRSSSAVAMVQLLLDSGVVKPGVLDPLPLLGRRCGSPERCDLRLGIPGIYAGTSMFC